MPREATSPTSTQDFVLRDGYLGHRRFALVWKRERLDFDGPTTVGWPFGQIWALKGKFLLNHRFLEYR